MHPPGHLDENRPRARVHARTTRWRMTGPGCADSPPDEPVRALSRRTNRSRPPRLRCPLPATGRPRGCGTRTSPSPFRPRFAHARCRVGTVRTRLVIRLAEHRSLRMSGQVSPPGAEGPVGADPADRQQRAVQGHEDLAGGCPHRRGEGLEPKQPGCRRPRRRTGGRWWCPRRIRRRAGRRHGRIAVEPARAVPAVRRPAGAIMSLAQNDVRPAHGRESPEHRWADRPRLGRQACGKLPAGWPGLGTHPSAGSFPMPAPRPPPPPRGPAPHAD
ncbi:hypothetical protein RKD44_000126 [Streptomyces collinus]